MLRHAVDNISREFKTKNNISGRCPVFRLECNSKCIPCNYTEATYWNRCDQNVSRVGQRSLRDLEVSVYWIYSKFVCIHSTSSTFGNSREIFFYEVLNISGNSNSFLYRKSMFLFLTSVVSFVLCRHIMTHFWPPTAVCTFAGAPLRELNVWWLREVRG